MGGGRRAHPRVRATPTGHLAHPGHLRTTRPLLPETGVWPILRPESHPPRSRGPRSQLAGGEDERRGTTHHRRTDRPRPGRSRRAHRRGLHHRQPLAPPPRPLRLPTRLHARRQGVVLARRHRGVPHGAPGGETRRADKGRPPRRPGGSHRLGRGGEVLGYSSYRNLPDTLLDHPDRIEKLSDGRVRRLWYRRTVWAVADAVPGGSPPAAPPARPVPANHTRTPTTLGSTPLSRCWPRPTPPGRIGAGSV